VNLRSYALVTGGYWAFTITDGALRMLVLLHFHDLGYSPVSLAFLFLLYELFGVVTNLLGGWVGARTGLGLTLRAGLAVQVVALLALSFRGAEWSELVSVVFVMVVQAASGVAKDLTKMSSKAAVKFMADDGPDGTLFRWVAVLTGSKNALKGVGFFVGGLLLAQLGYSAALRWMAATLAVVLVVVVVGLRDDIGRAKRKPPLRSVFAKSTAINRLSMARFFLFGSRDVWFVVALPVFLADEFGWSFEAVGAFLASWVIGYGIVQAAAPRLAGAGDVAASQRWLIVLVVVAVGIAAAVGFGVAVRLAVVGGLLLYGVVFAVNSAIHSYLILALSVGEDDVAMDVGFYYSANAAGRMVGTLLSGLLALAGGLTAALWGSVALLLAALATTNTLRAHSTTSVPGTNR
jgi:predicted MFS family arabinose efflux permease